MPDKSKQLYDLYKSNGLINKTSYDEFSNANDEQKKQLYDLGKNKGLFKQTGYDTFSSAFKKKVPSELKSESSSQGTQEMEKPEPSVSSGSEGDGLYIYAKRPGVSYKKIGSDWLIDIDGSGDFKKINEQSRIDELNRNAIPKTNWTGDNAKGATSRPKLKTSINPLVNATQAAIEEKKAPTKEEVKRQEVLSNQQYLKSKGYKLPVNGDANDKNYKLAMTQERAKDLQIEKQGFKTADIYDKIDTAITKSLVSKDEVDVVNELRNKFGKDGFEFEEGLGDQLIVRTITDNGVVANETTIDLDNWFDSSDNAEAKKLSDFMKQSYLTKEEKKAIDNPENVESLVELMASNPYKYSQELVDEDWFEGHLEKERLNLYALNGEAKSLRDKYDALLAEYKKDPTDSKQKELLDLADTLDELGKKITKDQSKLNRFQYQYKKAVGTLAKKELSIPERVEGQLVNFLASAPMIEKAALNVATDVLPYVLGDSFIDPLTRAKLERAGYSEDEMRSYASNVVKRTIGKDVSEGLVNVASLGTMTAEDINKIKTEGNDFEKTLGFLGESFGAAAGSGGNPLLTKIAFAALAYNAIEEEMSGSEFDDMTQAEKYAISIPYSLTIGALDALGFKFATGASKNPLVKKVIGNTLRKVFTTLPKGASASVIDTAIKQNLKAVLLESGIKIVGGALVEGATEGAQQLDEIAIKNIANQVEGYDYFKNTPDLTTKEGRDEALKLAATDAYYGALGGLIMSGAIEIYGDVSRYNADKKMDLTFTNYERMIKSKPLRNAYISGINQRVANGEITREEADKQIDRLNTDTSILESIPEDITDLRNRRQAFALLNERRNIESQIQGKDEALVARQKDRINAINEELKNISNAVTQSTEQQQEGTAESSVSERQRVDEGQQEVGQGEGSKRETEKPSANTSDSNITSEEEKVDRLIESRISNYNLQPDDLFSDMSEADNNIIERATKGENVDINALNGTIDYLYNKYKEVVALKKNNEERLNKSVTTAYLDDIQSKLDNDLDFLMTYKGEIEQGNNPITLDEFNNTPKQEQVATAEDIDIEDVKTIDPKDELYSKKIYDILEAQKQALIRFSKENTGSFIIPPSVLIKAIEGIQKAVELGMTFENAIREYASKNNLKVEDIENGLYTISEAQKRKTRERLTGEKQPTAKKSKEAIEAKELSKRKTKKVIVDEVKSLKDQIKLEAKAAKEGAKSVSDAIKAITRHFNSLSEKDKLNRKDLIKIINLISKVKNPETLNNTIPKLFDIMDNANKDIIEVNERLALKTQLKLEAKAAKNVAVETRKKQLEVRKELSEMYKKGTITTAQNRVILRKLANLNFLSQKSVDIFLSDYAKVMNNAEYAQKVSDGFKKRRTIKRYLKNNQPTLQTIVKDFLKINPTTVEDIDAYNELADDIVNATKPTKIKDGESDEKVAIEYNSTIDKIGKMIEHQEELAKQRLLDEYNDLVEEGIIDSDMSLSDIKSILESNESTDEETKSALDVAKELLQSKLPSLKGVTDKLMSKVADVDIELLDKKDIIKLAEAIENYLMNGVTDGVGAIMAKYTGKKNSLLAKAKLKATRIEWLINKKNIASRFGFKKKASEMTTKRALLKWRAENFNSLPIIIERIFKGVTNAAQFTKISGLQAVETGIVAHKKLSSAKEKQFHDKFSKAKMKFGRFNDALNVVERFIYADLSRNAGKTELEANKEFDIAYQNIEKSIESLNKSSIEEDKLKARLYEAALSKIKKGTYAEFLENPGGLDPVNIEAVKFAVDSFAEIFPELSRVSLDYYNTELKPEANYASSRFIRNVNPSVDIKEEADYRDEKLVSTKETKPMKAAKRSLIKDGEYIDGTFDTNFFKSYKDSLLAIHTSEARMQLKEFMKDENLREIISDIEDRGMLQRAIANYISDTMGYTREIDDKTLLKITNALNKYAAVRNLGSVASVVKQSIPVALNTLIITGEMPLPLNPLEGVRSDINDWLNRNNISVSQRGEENAVGQQRANKYKAKLQENTASIKNKVGHANELIREYSMKPLAFGDIVSNKLSWIAFYKQSLREQGIDTKNINWDKHELNEDASAYATQMIERAQNPSDFNKMAKFFKDKGQWTNIVKSILIPYSSFNINAKKKMVNDSVTLFSETSSDFDKKIAFRSMVGTTAEIASFNAIGLAWRYLVIQAIASSITGDDEEDKGLDREVMYALKNTYSELVSPSPMFNEPTLVATGWAYDKFFRKDQESIDAENKKREENGEEKMTPEEEKRFLADKIANDPTHEAKGKNFFDSFGSIGTIGKSAYETFELGETINNKYFIDKYKNLKELTPQQIEKLKGIMIVEGLSNLIGIPKDIKSIAKTAEKNILYNSLSEAGIRRLNETQEYLGRDLTDTEFKLARKSKNTDNLIYVIDELKGKEKAKEEAFKLLKEGVDIVDFEIMDKLRAGKTAEQIMKEVE